MLHILESQQFNKLFLDNLFYIADEIAFDETKYLQGKMISLLFFEPSTRTMKSFEAAAKRLGAGTLALQDRKVSSRAKGEDLHDTILTMAQYSDAIVMRHSEIGKVKEVAKYSPIPVINAGDGAGQHPTQALLDLYTIKKELGRIDNLKIAMVGDLANGRTVRSLCYLLTRYKNIKIFFVSPKIVKMRDDIKIHLTEYGLEYVEEENLSMVLKQADLVYMTRIQKERFGDRLEDYEQIKDKYILTPDILPTKSKLPIILHPLPRLNEISKEVDADPRAAYFRQVKNGMWIRMALLLKVFG